MIIIISTGLGADKSNEDNWLSHQLEFDDLLSRLNDHSENGNGEFSSSSFWHSFSGKLLI